MFSKSSSCQGCFIGYQNNRFSKQFIHASKSSYCDCKCLIKKKKKKVDFGEVCTAPFKLFRRPSQQSLSILGFFFFIAIPMCFVCHCLQPWEQVWRVVGWNYGSGCFFVFFYNGFLCLCFTFDLCISCIVALFLVLFLNYHFILSVSRLSISFVSIFPACNGAVHVTTIM